MLILGVGIVVIMGIVLLILKLGSNYSLVFCVVDNEG